MPQRKRHEPQVFTHEMKQRKDRSQHPAGAMTFVDDGQMDGWVNGWMVDGEWMDGWMDR